MNIIVGKNLSPLCFLSSGKLVCYKWGYILIMEGNKVVSKLPLFCSFKERWLGRIKPVFRLLRLGIRAVQVLDDETIIISIGNMLYELDISTGQLSEGYFIGVGIRPLIFAEVKGIESFDDCICFGGYLSNFDKKPVHIYKRTTIDKWEIIYTFEEGTINHVHNIVADSYRNCLWVFTGDFDEAAAIWKVTDNFKKVERVLSGDQKYRGCVVFPVKEGLLYATDAPFALNYMYLMKENLSVEQLCEIDGSCIYGCQVGNKYAISTTVEPDGRRNSTLNLLVSRKRGAGIRDMCSHLYVGNLSEGFKEIYKEKKDLWSYLFQFGAIRFPYGYNPTNMLYFQPVATDKHDLDLLGIDCMCSI